MRPLLQAGWVAIDFETTGMSPGQNCRATEIAVVMVEDGRIVQRYQSLMNSGAYVPPFIENLTGISNAMLRSAPPAAQRREFQGLSIDLGTREVCRAGEPVELTYTWHYFWR